MQLLNAINKTQLLEDFGQGFEAIYINRQWMVELPVSELVGNERERERERERDCINALFDYLH